MKSKKTPRGGIAVIAFLKQVQAEITQVTWPTREEAMRMTAVVILASVLVGVYLGALDYLFTYLMGLII